MNSPSKLHENVLIALSGLEAEYKVHEHSDLSSEIRNPRDFAEALGYPIHRITKTLLLRSHDRQTYAVAVCSTNRRLNFKSTAKAMGAKRVEAASPEELHLKTSYPVNGVSPFGLAEDIAVLLDSSLTDYPTVLVGGGATSVEIEIRPDDLVRISRATVTSVTRDELVFAATPKFTSPVRG